MKLLKEKKNLIPICILVHSAHSQVLLLPSPDMTISLWWPMLAHILRPQWALWLFVKVKFVKCYEPCVIMIVKSYCLSKETSIC